ncbi:hypothetical protein [Mucilaginibacter sp. OK098]|uniref:hypothetical protein n=1 Tax=Mucilaginibacter sp. OK098 TaxID=1855297 RepID=UPI00135633BB|nr:hypothetical protein [Mucilaginibacter sp. OK098]
MQTPQLRMLILKLKAMKKKFVAFALLISAIVSVTSGCYVEGGYGGHHHHYYRHGY